jgi:MFS family permease
MSRNLILSAVLVASCVSFVSIPLFGHMSDRIGRRRMYLIGAVATGLFGFLYFGWWTPPFRQRCSSQLSCR